MHKVLIILSMISAMLMANLTIAKGSQATIAVVVASKQNIVDLKLSSKNLNLIYWRKQLFWPKGLRIQPVNLRSQHPMRMQFSQTVLGSTPKAQIDYWNGQYFNGILPPHSVNSEEAVLRYVAKTKGAIGYINACTLDKRVQAVLWIKNGKILRQAPSLSCH